MNQRELTAKFEGLRLKPYRCPAGKLTIGYGHNIDAHPLVGDIGAYFKAHGGITQQMAEILLDNDLNATKSALLRNLPWIADLSAIRQMVLVDMAFNLGLAGLLEFKNTLALIGCGEYGQAADAMLKSKWSKQVKGRATTLAELMRHG